MLRGGGGVKSCRISGRESFVGIHAFVTSSTCFVSEVNWVTTGWERSCEKTNIQSMSDRGCEFELAVAGGGDCVGECGKEPSRHQLYSVV